MSGSIRYSNAQPPAVWETMMRFTPAAIAAALILATVSSTTLGAPARPAPIAAASVAMQREGERLRLAGELDDAIGFFETAIAADPRNVAAYVGLAAIARAQNLPGKAIAFYREALALSPQDRDALAGQGEALAERGAIEKASENLARVESLCGSRRCPEAARITAAITAANQRNAQRQAQAAADPVVPPATETAPPVTN